MSIEITKGEPGELPFGIIQNADILTGQDMKILHDLAPELKESFLKSQTFRTRTEMEVSVLNDVKHPTHASKFWQATREQNVMFTETVYLSYEYRKNLIEIEKLERDLLLEDDDLEKKLIQVEIEKKRFNSKQQEKTAKARIREIQEWSEIKAREASYMSGDELSDVDNHQLVSYVRRWIRQRIAMDDKGSPAERHNLLGQLYSGLKVCEREGLLDTVLEGFPEDVVSKLTSENRLLLR